MEFCRFLRSVKFVVREDSLIKFHLQEYSESDLICITRFLYVTQPLFASKS